MAKLKQTAVTDRYRRSSRDSVGNKYFQTVSNRYMYAKFSTLVLLVLFCAFMLIGYSEDISYSNLMYLLRDFDTDSNQVMSSFESIKYDEQSNMSYALYKGELTVAGNRTLKMYNFRGTETRSYEQGYSDPVLVSSDKYLLSYNVGTPLYSVYTSIARVYSGTAPGNIQYADMNDRGEHLLVCRSTDSKYAVYTFDSAFNPIAEYSKSRYVTTASIGDDGRVVIASFDSDGVAYDCKVELYYDGSVEPDATYSLSGIFPVKCGIWKSGGYYVICTDRILFFDKSGELIKSSESTYEYTAYSQFENYLAVSHDNDSLGGTSTFDLFGDKGEVIHTQTLEGSISSISVSDKTVYALAGSKGYMISIDKGEVNETAVDEGGAVLVSYGNSCVICYKEGAKGLLFGDDGAEVTSSITSSK